MSKRSAIYSIILVALITLGLSFTLPGTFFDYNFDKFFQPSDEATEYYQKHRETFGTDNDFVLIGLVSKSGVFNQEFLDKVHLFTEDLEKVSYVTKVVSPTNLKLRIREPLTGVLFEPKLLRNSPKDSLRVFSDPLMKNNFFSADTPAASILLITDERLSKEKSDILAAELFKVTENYSFDGIHIAGKSIGQVAYINKIRFEFSLFMAISIIFVIGLLYLMFKSLRGIIIPLSTVIIAVIWSIGILNLSGRGISILLNMLPPVVFVVGMSDAVHLYSRYIEELKRGRIKSDAIRAVIFDTGLATFFTSITTAIGFASLYFTGIPALQEFGLITAAGVLAAFVIAILLLPAWLVFSKEPHKSLKSANLNFWDKVLARIFAPIIRGRKIVYTAAGVLTLVFAFGFSQLELNNFLLEDLKPEEPLRKDFAFFDKYFAGVRPFELGIKLKDEQGSLTDPEHLMNIAKIETYLTDVYGVGAILSPVSIAKEINRMNKGGDNSHFRLPDKPSDWKRVSRDLDNAVRVGRGAPLLAEDRTYGRISGRVSDLGGRAFAEKNVAFKNFLRETGFDDIYHIDVTGTGTLIDRTNRNLVGSLAKGLGVAFLLIGILMGFLFGSLRMVLIALLPNLLPLMAVGAIMAWSDIDLKMSTGIIFTIAFGIAVDDTIHMLSRYKLELVKGKSNILAIKNAFIHTGKALIITSIILFGGFISLCFSTFQSTFYIGLLVTLTLIFALIFDLTLLPALVAGLGKGKLGGIGNFFADKSNDSVKYKQAERKGNKPRQDPKGAESG